MTTIATHQISSHTPYHSQITIDDLDHISLRQIKSAIYEQVEQARIYGINLETCELYKIEEQLNQYNCNHHMQSCLRNNCLLQEVYMMVKAAVSSTSGDKAHCIHFDAS